MATSSDLPILQLPPGTAPPDLMNDPQYATNTANVEDEADADTCRICRGEGSASEYLFHPCKCSGSIKYVHQDCLMEWLSHSQKKHCELCKTPFRFTKLYSPNMPQSIPFHVLCRHVAINSVRNIGTWLRFCLVVAVWLGALPYVIRQVWRLLFWFSDGGWPYDYLPSATKPTSTAAKGLEVAIRDFQRLSNNGTSPVTPLRSFETTAASIGGIMDQFLGFIMPLSQTLNISDSDPLTAGLFKTISYGLGIQSTDAAALLVNTTLLYLSHGSQTSTLLSEVPFLRSLTRHQTFNDLVIAISEGYIITISVVVCFILVFLIREWVVQQQPGINIGAGFNAEFAMPDRRDQDAQVDDFNLPRPPPRVLRGENDLGEIGQRPMARPRRRPRGEERGEGPRIRRRPRVNLNDRLMVEDGEVAALGVQNRPVAVRNALEPASEVQRFLADEPRLTEEFLTIWRRADSDPGEVLRIIDRENKGDQMRYWVNAMKILELQREKDDLLQGLASPANDFSDTRARGALASTNSILDPINPGVPAGDPQSDGGSESSGSWQEIARKPAERSLNTLPLSVHDGVSKKPAYKDKGKGKADDALKPLLDDEGKNLESAHPILTAWDKSWPTRGDSTTSSALPSRPRAISDGPQIRETISPLANNNWSFSTLSGEKIPDYLPVNDEDRRAFAESPSAPSGSSLAPEKKQAKDRGAFWKAAQDLRVQQGVAKDREVIAMREDSQTMYTPVIPPDIEDASSVPESSLRLDGQDETITAAQDWDEVLDSVAEEPDLADDYVLPPQHNLLHLGVPLPRPRAPIAAPLPAQQGVLENVADFLWGGVEGDRREDETGANDEHIVQDLAAEAPFVPVPNPNQENLDILAEAERQVLEAAAVAGDLDLNDLDAIDDAEDFEGIMELVGMRGPIFSLVQNALFSAFLLALTVAIAIWIPYNIGRVSMLLITNPGPTLKLPLRLIFGFAAFLQDLALSLIGAVSYFTIFLVEKLFNYRAYDTTTSGSIIKFKGVVLGQAALNITAASFERIANETANGLENIFNSEIFAFSAATHESLIYMKSIFVNTLSAIAGMVMNIIVGDYKVTGQGIWTFLSNCVEASIEDDKKWFVSISTFLARPDSWVISLDVAKRSTPLDLNLSVWDGYDRFWAITAGYTALCVLGALYVRKGSPFSSGQYGRDLEATVIDFLNQAGGVMKVILIISIEMLVFPLYCGLLLDAALLPLFERTTIMSRILFTFKSPLTSIFVHWFVGTCYMFHFALFVSMCRKIMRKGVLYFIRDPDDPTFHPVRDVLERNVATQLRKILFSALVYGGLVVICLGGVVWGLAYICRGVLPIHWSSNEPVLEFPIDLLFYNFLMPLAVKFFKPSDGLHAMYTWWFRRCARMLRLTWFMFDERKIDEEGYSVRRTWGDVIRGVKGDAFLAQQTDNINQPFETQPDLRAYFHRDGRYVRAPATDQVRIPKGTPIFLEVSETNTRIDDTPDSPHGVHGKDSYQNKQVYIPPHFRSRIFLFILSIWLFAATTGVCITIVPLVFGRYVFARLIPSHVRKNDVYAFSIGIYILGSALYAVLHLRLFFTYLRTSLSLTAETPQNLLRQIATVSSLVARITWTYFAFLFLLPTLFAFVVEFYMIVPLHTYFFLNEPHTIHFVQSWTLGLLYVKLTTRLILWHSDSRPAQSLRAIIRNGYLNPDARLATRSFILPAALLLSMALVAPLVVAQAATLTLLKGYEEKWVLAYRYAYPLTAAVGMIAVGIWFIGGWIGQWRLRIRDDVYLIGERLHNFGERKTTKGDAGNGIGVRRLET